MCRNRITVVCGHYGCGKTNLSLNLAMEIADKRKNVRLVDMDIVNPYFRSSEYGEILSKRGVELIKPVYANTTMDTPAIPPQIYSIFGNKDEDIIIDSGGDDVGITALGIVQDKIIENGYEMLYVINMYRMFSQTPDEAISLLREIEAVSKLRPTAIVNNSHLGVETTYEVVEKSISFAQKTAELAGVPLLYSTVPDFAVKKEINDKNIKTIKRFVKFNWEF